MRVTVWRKIDPLSGLYACYMYNYYSNINEPHFIKLNILSGVVQPW